MNNYTFDHINNTLTVTASFLKKAGILNSPEYKTIMQFKANHPGLEIKKADTPKREQKYHVKLAQMVQFIKTMDRLNQTKVYDQYQTVKELSRIQRSPYKYMEDWFRKTYPNFDKVVSFDEKGQMFFNDSEENQAKNTLTVVNADEKLEAIA